MVVFWTQGAVEPLKILYFWELYVCRPHFLQGSSTDVYWTARIGNCPPDLQLSLTHGLQLKCDPSDPHLPSGNWTGSPGHLRTQYIFIRAGGFNWEPLVGLRVKVEQLLGLRKACCIFCVWRGEVCVSRPLLLLSVSERVSRAAVWR